MRSCDVVLLLVMGLSAGASLPAHAREGKIVGYRTSIGIHPKTGSVRDKVVGQSHSLLDEVRVGNHVVFVAKPNLSGDVHSVDTDVVDEFPMVFVKKGDRTIAIDQRGWLEDRTIRSSKHLPLLSTTREVARKFVDEGRKLARRSGVDIRAVKDWELEVNGNKTWLFLDAIMAADGKTLMPDLRFIEPFGYDGWSDNHVNAIDIQETLEATHPEKGGDG